MSTVFFYAHVRIEQNNNKGNYYGRNGKVFGSGS